MFDPANRANLRLENIFKLFWAVHVVQENFPNRLGFQNNLGDADQLFRDPFLSLVFRIVSTY